MFIFQMFLIMIESIIAGWFIYTVTGVILTLFLIKFKDPDFWINLFHPKWKKAVWFVEF